MPLFLAKHGLFLVIMLLHMLLLVGYSFDYALFFGVTCPKKAIMLLHLVCFYRLCVFVYVFCFIVSEGT